MDPDLNGFKLVIEMWLELNNPFKTLRQSFQELPNGAHFEQYDI